MDHLLSLESFVAVVESGGFSAASRRLRVPLATDRLAGAIVEPENDGKGYVRTTLNGVSMWSKNRSGDFHNRHLFSFGFYSFSTVLSTRPNSGIAPGNPKLR